MDVGHGDIQRSVIDAGYGSNEPVIVGVEQRGHGPELFVQGATRTHEALSPDATVYVASLAKQLTAACLALLVREGAVDLHDPLDRWLPELPGWAGTIYLRHLLFHTAGLPDDEVNAIIGRAADRTSQGVVAALSRIPDVGDPGTTHRYSNASYVCLALVLERAAGLPLPVLADAKIFTPLGMRATRYWAGPAPAPPGAVPLGASHPAPLSLGDGGVWSSARDLLRWCRALNADELSISASMEVPGTLDDGTLLDYAWGMGVRSHRGHRVYRHGGGWPSLRALLARIPDLGAGVVILALADESERRVELADRLLDRLTA